MVASPRRAEENLEADLALVRAQVRMRLGVVAAIVLVGLYQTNFETAPAGGAGFGAMLSAALPVLGIAVAGALIVFALGWRDAKQVRAKHEPNLFRVPKRKTRP